MSKGCERRLDQDGNRWVYGEVRLKFVVKVNVARDVRIPYIPLAFPPPIPSLNTGGRGRGVP